MEATELLKKVRKIEIKTRKLSHNIFAGEYHSAFKGRGMLVSEIREYQYGDDFRDIDWKVTARFQHPFVKVYEEERELTVMLLIDVSESKDFGTQNQIKRDLMTELAAILSFSAIENNDKVGVIFFSNQIEKFIPPRKGKKHILRIIRELIDFEPKEKGTDVGLALRYLTNAIKRRSSAFIISDFISPDFKKPLQIANHRHEIFGIQIFDTRETEIPNIGMIYLRNTETGKLVWVDTSSREFRKNYFYSWQQNRQKLKETFATCGINYVSIATNENFTKPLMSLFKKK